MFPVLLQTTVDAGLRSRSPKSGTENGELVHGVLFGLTQGQGSEVMMRRQWRSLVERDCFSVLIGSDETAAAVFR